MLKQNILTMTRYDNETYVAPIFYSTSSTVSYCLWQDESREKYVQLRSDIYLDDRDLSLGCSNYFFPLGAGVFLGYLEGFDRHFELKKVDNIDVILKVKSVMKHYYESVIVFDDKC
ncbi:hypothetical protein [Photobacterium damselae]|uniref:hypothetical protein n=1 Tax=Photobacterium damselae TaxID=38293 RepID=UPI001F423725|nr:hypothetical protein [Photobacterium damselae]UKA11733.1 hypothetical protein IHC91_18290 [Photobacterium damselae subsp. damselae]